MTWRTRFRLQACSMMKARGTMVSLPWRMSSDGPDQKFSVPLGPLLVTHWWKSSCCAVHFADRQGFRLEECLEKTKSSQHSWPSPAAISLQKSRGRVASGPEVLSFHCWPGSHFPPLEKLMCNTSLESTSVKNIGI